MKDIQYRNREAVGVLAFDAVELRAIAYALGLHDSGAQEMLELADRLDVINGVLA